MATGYTIYRMTDDMPWKPLIGVYDTTEYVDTNVEPGTVYTYRVRAFSANGAAENDPVASLPGDLFADTADLSRRGVLRAFKL